MYEFLKYQVSDVMTRKIVTVRPETTLLEAEELFDLHDVNGLPVLNADDHLAGWITKLDVLGAYAFTSDSIVPRYEEIIARPVGSVMAREPITVRPDLPLTRALHLLVETGKKSFPVLQGEDLVGVVAREDVLRALRRAAKGEGPDA